MKHTLSILMLILFANFSNAQTNNYKTLWDKVEKLEVEGLPKSALKIVEDISKLSIKENNHTQQIKTLLFKSKFALILEEDAQLKIINDFKNQITSSEFPVKNVLENILANMYWQYFNQNRWKFYNRTRTQEKVAPSSGSGQATDFRTWDLQTVFNDIHKHYQNSLQNGLMLQLEPLNNFDGILTNQKGSKTYRPTLFDFLSHNALEFYKTNETHITKPAYKFEIDNEVFLGDALTFSKLAMESKDTTSLQLHALKIYRNLIQFHLKDKAPEALTDVNIQRLKFVEQYATFKDKQILLLKALKAEREHLKNHEVSALYGFEMASIYFKHGQKYNPKSMISGSDDTSRWKIKEALELCNQVITSYPKSDGAEKCTILRQDIKQQSLQITTEDFLPIQKNARLLVRYKNLEKLQFKVYKLSRSQWAKFNKTYRKEDQLKFIKKLKRTTTEWQSTLRNENDYQMHSTEVLLPPLDNGTYLIFASIENDKSAFAFSTVQVTDLALVESDTNDHKIFQFINRNNGKPISNAQVELSYNEKNNRSLHTEDYTTNSYGEIKIKKTQNWFRNIKLQVRHYGDLAYFGDYYVNQYYNREEENVSYNSFLFTDRSIYRPGQMVYFKAIAMKTVDGKSEVIPNEVFYAELYDVNSSEVSALELKTNEFGSVSGEFILPNSGLNGDYHIELYADSDDIDIDKEFYFSIEEYKRPKFETKFNPVTETFKIDDSVTIKGHALAYAGSAISDAKVVYRVHRKVEYPYWYFWYHPRANSEPQEITHGEGITNDKGEFQVTFKAIPDSSVDKTGLPIFNYEVTVDVTDLNGETRSATTTVNVGYHTLTASISAPDFMDKIKKTNTIEIDTKNLNGEFVPAKGTIKIYKLKGPGNVLRQRPWGAPDYQEFSEETFKNLFPHDAYSNEQDPNHWKKGTLVLNTTFDTDASKTIKLGKTKKWASGQYIILLESKDKFGQMVKNEVKTTLYSNKDETLADHQLFSMVNDKHTYAPGETAILTLGSAAKNLTVTVTVEKRNEIVSTHIVKLNDNKVRISVPVTPEDHGGFTVHYSFAAFNSFKSGVSYIVVPYPKTELDIETTTFRDKLQPGTDEIWSFKIKGPKGDKVSAELLASMYDTSLDQFKPHNWTFNPINKPTFYTYNRTNARQSFGTRSFRVYQDRPRILYPRNHYDQLNWFGFSFNHNKWSYNNYISRLKRKYENKHKSVYSSEIKAGIVSGTVYDINGVPLAGTIITIKDSTKGTQTGFDGTYSIKVNKGQTLVFSYLGFVTQEIKIKKDNLISVYLTEDSAHLDEVVVVGYGTQKRKQVTGAVAAFSSERLEKVVELDDVEKTLSSLSEEDSKKIVDSLTVLEDKSNFDNVVIRKNLQEAAFFFPHLKTDESGHISFSFTTPEALTQWKLQLLAHTKTLESGTKTLTAVTQKELMVIPNTPRFLREGDQITISTKIANLTDKSIFGQAILILTDAISGKDISNQLIHKQASPHPSGELEGASFSVTPKGNTQISWQLSIPDNVQAVQYKIIAKSEDFSDGEQNAIPVLSNRMLVTETLPMWVRSNETRTFTLDKLKTNRSSSLKNHKLTLEITSNPAWYAVQALPYLMEYPYQCNEQTFSRYYANALASHIVNSNSRIKEVFDQWAAQDVLMSNLEKNEALKSILIQETPWLRDAQSETEQKKRIALLFDLNKMNSELQSARRKLEQNQMSGGAWSWFKGGYENRYITQHIITGFGHLKHLNVLKSDSDESMIKKAIKYLDAQFVKEYHDIRKYNSKADLNKDHLSYTQLHYLYMRSFYPEIKTSKEVDEIRSYYQNQIQKYWLKRPLYAKGLMALISHRNDDMRTSAKILRSLKENSITSDELGMYWKSNTNSWYWYQAPIETQALMVEVFSEVGDVIQSEAKNLSDIDNLKIWLLKNKQTNRWKTTKATTDAVYALLLQGSDWLSDTDMVDVVLGEQPIDPSVFEDTKVEAGTGYFKTSWNASEIKPEMGEVKISKKGNGMAWGGLYWQYFEDLDKITSAETPLKLRKKLFLKTNTDTGEAISEITKETEVKIGDLVRVRIELQSDRAMEFVHMKDMRASGLEPINVLSQYKWQDGLGYYESTKDASTNFFFDYLPKGVYVFEYDLRVNNAGDMSNGITTIQSMYAPEFSSHSEGVRIVID